MDNRRVISEPEKIEKFTFAGKALFTLKSRKTESRFTYKVRLSKDKKVFFVSAKLDSSFVYMGYIKLNDKKTIIWTPKSKTLQDTTQFKAFQWFLKNIGHEAIEFWHEGRCGHCSKKLTVPESIVSGFGPVCLGRKVTKAEVQKIQIAQSIESINDLIKGRIGINDSRFKDVIRTAKNDLVESQRREKFSK